MNSLHRTTVYSPKQIYQPTATTVLIRPPPMNSNHLRYINRSKPARTSHIFPLFYTHCAYVQLRNALISHLIFT